MLFSLAVQCTIDVAIWEKDSLVERESLHGKGLETSYASYILVKFRTVGEDKFLRKNDFCQKQFCFWHKAHFVIFDWSTV